MYLSAETQCKVGEESLLLTPEGISVMGLCPQCDQQHAELYP